MSAAAPVKAKSNAAPIVPEEQAVEREQSMEEGLQALLGNRSGVERTALLLMSLGEEYAAEILKHVEPWELHRIGSAMATMDNVNREQISAVLGLFNRDIDQQTSMGIGNQEYVEGVMIRAVGRDRAKGVIDRIYSGEGSGGVDALKWLDPYSIAVSLRHEHPQVVALVLASLDPEQGAEVMAMLPEGLRFDALWRVATLDTVPSEALAELNDLVENQVLRRVGVTSTTQLGGANRAAELLNRLDGEMEGVIIQRLKQEDPELSERVEELMLVFESLLDVTDRGIQSLLKAVPQESLLMAMRGADEALREKFFRNLSKRAAALLKDDLEAMPPVKLSEVEAAQKEIMVVAKQLEEAGELSLGGGGDYV